MFAQAWREVEERAAKERQRAAGKNYGENHPKRGQVEVKATLPEPLGNNGKSRDKVAARVGVVQLSQSDSV